MIGPDSSLKRIAWAYGCAKKNSADESMLRGLLLDKAKAEPTEYEGPCLPICPDCGRGAGSDEDWCCVTCGQQLLIHLPDGTFYPDGRFVHGSWVSR